jgi:hypothetical protein
MAFYKERHMTKWMSVGLGIIVFTAAASFGVSAQQNQMSFFVTSVGTGNGANLGGLAGADKHCQTLAAAAGGGNRTWRAYLSTAAAAGQPAVNAKDRIGKGPWHGRPRRRRHVVEFRPWFQGMLAAESRGNGRQRALLLLRGELRTAGKRESMAVVRRCDGHFDIHRGSQAARR